MVIAGAGGMQLGTGGTDAAGELALNVHVHIFQLDGPVKITGLNISQDAFKAGLNGLKLSLCEHACTQLCACMGYGAGNVVPIEFPIV